MASPPILGLVEVSNSLEANMVSSPHTTPIYGKWMVSSRSGMHSMGNVLPSILAMDDNTIQDDEMMMMEPARCMSQFLLLLHMSMFSRK
ncbi:hypothetical protein LWI28_007398 [Acer negundo]|uniref:Uncharacterized protein n=1 Tax=Acer negundo TaxID=4023 RepID=A0AAD5P2V0_ACENE|nr:hypothetical protein LWI28_007398 [Acer negundo]